MLEPFHSHGERDGFGEALAAGNPRMGFALPKELPAKPEPPHHVQLPPALGSGEATILPFLF